MHKTKPTTKTEAMPGTDLDLLGLDLRLHDIEVEALDIELDFPEIELAELNLDTLPPSRPPAAPTAPPATPMPSASGKSVRTTIRLPHDVVMEFKRRAAADGKRYQRLIVVALREWLISRSAASSAP